jgi:hypothetical protein
MDQGPESLPEHRPSPTIVGPANNDSIEDHTLTVWGTAEPGAAVELWDWLSLVARTEADKEGRWSITLQDVESGDHVYFAQTIEASNRPAERSDTTTVRVGSPNKHWQVKRTPVITLPWHPPQVGLIRKLRGRKRQANDEDWKGDAFVDEEWERIIGAPERPPSSHQPSETLQDEPARARYAAEEPSELPPIIQSEPKVESESVVDEEPIDVLVTMIMEGPRLIEAPVETVWERLGLVDLGPADVVSEAPSIYPLRSTPVIATAIPMVLQVDRVAIDPPPMYLPIRRLAPPDPARFLGTAALVAEPSSEVEPQLEEESRSFLSHLHTPNIFRRGPVHR